MKMSELVAILEELQEENGDLIVLMADSEHGDLPIEHVIVTGDGKLGLLAVIDPGWIPGGV